jgi:AP endonuclease-2
MNVPQTTKFIDSFRSFHPGQESAFTCWCARTGARQTNYGTRIDYIFSSADYFKKEFTDCIIRPDIDGSDHCPVVATLRNSFQNAEKPPPLCTKYMPEFSGKQKKLKDFFKRSEGNTNLHDLNETGNKMSENAKLVNANESRSGMENSAKPKSSEKRPAQSTLKSKAKRLKTKNGVSQGKISRFFEKKSTKPIEGNIPMECTTVSSVNESDSGISEGMNEVAFQMDTQTNTSSQNSTSSSCSGSDCSTKSSSQKATGSTNKAEQKAVIASWKNILKGPPPAPLCSGHKEPCVLRTVKNKGPNHGKKFYCCARPDGHSTNKEARCKHFIWVKK